MNLNIYFRPGLEYVRNVYILHHSNSSEVTGWDCFNKGVMCLILMLISSEYSGY
jgi:hypothetical protein